MKVSVIIPTRNMADLLDRAVKSVQAQTYPVHEIIIADDNSTDSTSLWLAENMRPGGNILATKNGGEPWGICGGRNAAFSMSTGDAILPLDADDWIDPKYLEKTIPVLEADDKAAIVSTEMVYHGMNEGQIMPIRKENYATELEANNITVTSLVRRAALEQAGPWDNNLRGWEDWDMWLRILKNGWKHAVVKEPLFHYRLNTGGMNQWANEHKGQLYRYLVAKHPGFASIRAAGQRWNEI